VPNCVCDFATFIYSNKFNGKQQQCPVQGGAILGHRKRVWIAATSPG